MKTVGRMVFAGALLFAISASAGAQFKFGGGPQFAVAFSSFKDNFYGTGLVFGGHGDLGLNKYLTLRLAFDYATFGADNGKLKSGVQDQAVQATQKILGRDLTADEITTVKSAVTSASGARVSAPVISVSALGKFPTRSMVTPYAIIGLGMSFLSSGDLSITGDGAGVTANGQQIVDPGTVTSKIDSQSKFGMQFGAGGEVKLSKLVTLFLEIRYNLVFTTGGSSSYIPVMVGATFGE